MGAYAPRWGWHQLSREWAERLVADAGIRKGDFVLDVGAGRGAITEPLVLCGAQVLAIELHTERAHELRERFADAQVKVVVADAADLRLPRRPFHVVANPPFGATAGLLRRLTAPGSQLASAHVVVPWHVARRWSGPGAPGQGRWGDEFEVSLGRAIPRSAFRPASPNGVAILIVRRRSSAPQRRRRRP